MHPAELMKDFRLNPDGTDPFAFNNSGSAQDQRLGAINQISDDQMKN